MGRDERSNSHTFGGPRRPPSSLITPGGVPILGQRAEVLDAYGKPLAEGDVVLLQTVRHQPYQITKIGPAEGAAPGLLRIDLRAQAAFISTPNDPINEFLLLEKHVPRPAQPTDASPDPSTEAPPDPLSEGPA